MVPKGVELKAYGSQRESANQLFGFKDEYKKGESPSRSSFDLTIQKRLLFSKDSQ